MSDREAKWFCWFFMFAVATIGPIPILFGRAIPWPDNLFAYGVCWLYTMGAIAIVGTAWPMISGLLKRRRRAKEAHQS